MRAVVDLQEIRDFMAKDKKLARIKIKNIALNTIKVTYIMSLELAIVEVKPTTVTIQYKVGFLKNMLAKIAHGFLNDKIDKNIIHWDTDHKLVEVLLHNISQAQKFFQYGELENITISDDKVIVELAAR
ncbi:MAG: hypothetical protein LUE93_11230 [Bacteroides sp.]|nr:hypothetical protein [Bacteroides sp.]